MLAKLSSFSRILAVLALAALAAAPAMAAGYAIDGTHSSAIFRIKHFETAYFYGAFKEVSGTVTYDAENPAKSSIMVEIAAASADTRNTNRDDHVKSPDFLNAAEFPKITFKSTSVKAAGDDMLEVTGDFTLHGVTKPVTAEVELTGQGTHPSSGKAIIGFLARFTVDRTQHDMGFMAGPLSKEVDFILSVEAAAE
jgi:polyisoprenoid-binding protein YceI